MGPLDPERSSLNQTDDSLDPYDYHLTKCGEDDITTMECNQIHTYHPDEEVEEKVLDAWDREPEAFFKPDFCNGKNEMMKILNQKCVVCFERESVYAFRQCGHQCMCESCYQIKSDIDMLKSIVCRQGKV